MGFYENRVAAAQPYWDRALRLRKRWIDSQFNIPSKPQSHLFAVGTIAEFLAAADKQGAEPLFKARWLADILRGMTPITKDGTFEGMNPELLESLVRSWDRTSHGDVMRAFKEWWDEFPF